MTGSVNVIGNLPPAAFTVTGGGGFCPGLSGSDVSLSGSASGVSYVVYNGLTSTGITKAGTLHMQLISAILAVHKAYTLSLVQQLLPVVQLQ